jgi:chloramphenicol-sensitive protein RarD
VALGFLAYWSANGRHVFGTASVHDVLFILGLGVITSVPLLGFAHAARKLPFSLLGLLQFLAPTGQFIVGAFVYDEPLSRAALVAFAFIWTAVGTFCLNLFSQSRKPAGP